MTEELSVPSGGDGPRRVGSYELGPRLGEGGMGVVWRSQDREGREVSVKVLRPHIAHDENARARLRREVDTLARVHHPRVAAVLDADVDGPAPYIVTEFVPGAPLDAVVAVQGALPPEALVRLGEGLSDALGAIHEVGIVHRDLKPGNVLMVGDDPVVIDFGIAQVADDSRLTVTGMVMGTPGYLSPEVVEGGSVTRATDWWGWAATLAFAASGHPPFGTGPMSVVLDRVVRGRTQLDKVDEQLRPLLLAALDPDPSHRPGSEEVMAAMKAYAQRRPVTEAMSPRSLSAAGWVAGAGAAAAGGRHREAGEPAEQGEPGQHGQAGQPGGAGGTGEEDPAGAPTREHPVTAGDDSTQMTPVVDPTRAQPIPQTRAVPTGAPPHTPPTPPSGSPAYRDPQPYPHTERYPSQRYQGAGPRDRGPAPAQQPGRYPPPPPQNQHGQPGPHPGARPPQPPWERRPHPGAGQGYPPGQPYGGGQPHPGGRPPAGAAYPRAGGDPRIGRPPRTGTILTLLAVFVALCTVAPLLAWGLLAIWSVLTRWVDRSMTGLVMRRHTAGPRGSDIPMTLLAAPWRLIPAVLTTLLWLVLPLGFAVTAAFATSFGLTEGGLVVAEVDDPLPIAVGSALGAVVGWWGPGSVSLRRGTRTLLRAVVPSGPATQLVVTFLLVGSLTLGAWALLDPQAVSWWPSPTGQAPLLDRLQTQILGQRLSSF
ncbi:MAG TPA: protein kinase [Ornithinimicrobium sp.]|uniref:serine/threonine-protein kinase n=1 Tax=Ornithinimicrobium sp. TaxID=1977084 RepID=UPI002B47C773|nr:protein kinase [Ornithinimicrobium sp.]HKJ11340.1 protein kinase [Ornithinimicrobium sp.]